MLARGLCHQGHGLCLKLPLVGLFIRTTPFGQLSHPCWRLAEPEG